MSGRTVGGRTLAQRELQRARIKERGVATTDTLGGAQQVTFINEAGLILAVEHADASAGRQP